MNRNLMHLDDFKSHRVRLPIEANGTGETIANDKRGNGLLTYYDDSDSASPLPHRVRTPRGQAGGGVSTSATDPSVEHTVPGEEKDDHTTVPPLRSPHRSIAREEGEEGGRSSEHDSGDSYAYLVAQRRRSFGRQTIRRSKTTVELGQAYDPWPFSDDEHLSLAKQQEIQAVINTDPNDT
jgi:hypothetical protein